MISLEKQISDVAEGLKDVVTKSELADMMNSFVSDDDEKWLMFNAKFSSADEVYESIYKQAKSSIYVVDNYIGLRTLVHLKNSPTGVNITWIIWMLQILITIKKYQIYRDDWMLNMIE